MSEHGGLESDHVTAAAPANSTTDADQQLQSFIALFHLNSLLVVRQHRTELWENLYDSIPFHSYAALETTVFAYHGSPVIESPIGPLHGCQYKEGSCSTKTVAAVIWTPERDLRVEETEREEGVPTVARPYLARLPCSNPHRNPRLPLRPFDRLSDSLKQSV
uniref:Uncharacterized protein n=1 Tax=Haemonchus contortus TaxID=6289 RepID=A0A7I4Y032_HAECO